MKHFILFSLALISLSACSSSRSASQSGEIYDPYENTNRKIFAFNQSVDKSFINPTIRGYRTVTPSAARTGLRNLLRHLKSPVTFANQALQGDLEGAGTVALRATINTFVGFGGLMDTAAMEGIPYEEEDFGQTLAVWGVDHGPYIVVPFFGGVSARDGVGFGVDALADPLMHYVRNIDEDYINYTRAGLTYLTIRNDLYDVLKDLNANSFDPYSAIRSAYYQHREALVSDIGDKMRVNPTNNATSAFDDFY